MLSAAAYLRPLDTSRIAFSVTLAFTLDIIDDIVVHDEVLSVLVSDSIHSILNEYFLHLMVYILPVRSLVQVSVVFHLLFGDLRVLHVWHIALHHTLVYVVPLGNFLIQSERVTLDLQMLVVGAVLVASHAHLALVPCDLVRHPPSLQELMVIRVEFSFIGFDLYVRE